MAAPDLAGHMAGHMGTTGTECWQASTAPSSLGTAQGGRLQQGVWKADLHEHNKSVAQVQEM